MLYNVLLVVLVIVAVLVIGMIRESRRERSLRAWVEKKTNARLHWPFKADEHPSVPAAELTQLFIQRPPLGFASAVQITEAGSELWLIEFRTTPLGKESSRWFTLVARRAMNETPPESSAGSSGESWKVFGPWACHHREGLITVSLLEEALSTPQHL